MKTKLVAWTLSGVALLAALPVCADEQDWQFTLTPYLWLPTIDGNARYQAPPGGGGDPIFSVGPTDRLDLASMVRLRGPTVASTFRSAQTSLPAARRSSKVSPGTCCSVTPSTVRVSHSPTRSPAPVTLASS